MSEGRCLVVARAGIAVAGLTMLGFLQGASLFAQGTPDVEALTRAYNQEEARAVRLAAIEADRAGFISQALDAWRSQIPDRGTELEHMLRGQSVDRLLAASEAKSLSDVTRAARGMGPNVLGDADSDLVFFSVTPCRLFDTRLAGGALSPGVVRTFGVNGAVGSPGNMTPQGGAASDCGVPVDPAAVVVTLAAVLPSGSGNIRAWASGDPVPLASAINYGTALLAVANTTVIPVCMGCGTGLDIDVRSDGSTVHLVGDVVGYFWNPTGLPRVRRSEFTFVNVPGTNAVVTLTSITFTPSRSGNAVVQATGYCNIDQTGVTHGIGIGLSASPASGTQSRTAYMRVQAADAAGLHQEDWAIQDYVAVTAGVPVTVTLRAQQFSGSGPNEDCSGTLLVREEFTAS